MNEQNQQEILKIILKTLRNCYPNTFQITKQNECNYVIDIYFPIINITNRQKKKHVIYDIIVRIPITFNSSLDKYLIGTLLGTRLSLSKNEACSNYCHSHLNAQINRLWGNWNELMIKGLPLTQAELEKKLKDNTFEFDPFCLGYGGINNITYQLNTNTSKQLNINNWLLFFKSIKNYLEYESLEGGPYRKIDNIYAGSNSNIKHIVKFDDYFFIINRNKKNIYEYITKLIKEGVIKLYLNANFKIRYKYNEELEVLFYDEYNHLFYERLCSHKQNNNYWVISRNAIDAHYFSNEHIKRLETYYFPFRDYKIPCRLIDKDNMINRDEKLIKVIHPHIIKRILNEYITDLNNTKSRIINNSDESKTTASDF